ncbi:hypothetical protein PV773_09940 [Mesorhizobium sp. CC13]|uniref:hypothetical protein n=1 Tax=Mesorhizobium sp. CC13 TaxID=3029194 RepID=UPI003266E2AF
MLVRPQFVMALLALLVVPANAQTEDLVFTLTNGTSSALTEFYVSPVGVRDWEENILDVDMLAPGDSIEITIADGRSVCDYDMRFEFDADSDLDTTEDTQNLCELGEYIVRD